MIEAIRSYKGKTLFLAILCIVANLSYYPVFVANGIGRRVNTALWVLLGILILYDNKISFGGSLIRTYTILFALFVINSAVVSYFTGENAFDNHFFQPAMTAFVIFFCAYTLGYEIDKEKLIKICKAYFYSMLIISILLFFIYLRKTDLSTRYYEYRYGKNEISVLLMCALAIGCTVYDADTHMIKLMRVALIVFCVTDILYLRCRTVMVGIAILILVMVFSNKGIKPGLRMMITLFVIACTIFFIFNTDRFDTFLDQFIYAGRDSSDINDLSSGRSDQISYGMSVFRANELFGVGALHDTLDCFYVSVLANCGIFGWPLLVMAVVPFIWSIYNLKNADSVDLCFFVISASIFAEMISEELAPFGPGTRCYLLWLMWGILARRKRIEYLQKSAYIDNGAE